MDLELRKVDNVIKLKELFRWDLLIVAFFVSFHMIPFAYNEYGGAVFAWSLFVVWFFWVRLRFGPLMNSWFVALSRRSGEFLALGIFLIVISINYCFVNTNEKAFSYIFSFATMGLAMLMDSFYSVDDYKSKHKIIFIVIFILAIQASISIPYLLNSKLNVARLVSRNEMNASSLLEARKHGVGNNGLYMALAPIIIIGYAIKDLFASKLKAILYLCLILLIISIAVSSYLAPLFLIAFGIGFILVCMDSKLLRPKNIFRFVIVVILLIIFYNSFLAGTHIMRPIEERVLGFIDMGERYGFFSGAADVTGRGSLAEVSVNTFKNNPLWGVGVPVWRSYDIVGEHMPWIDLLANFGLLGGLPFFIYIFLLFKKNVPRYFSKSEFSFGNSKLYNKAMYSCFILYILSSFISPLIVVGGSYLIFVLVTTSIRPF